MRVLIVGAGGFGREILAYARDAYGTEREIAFLDDDRNKTGATIDGARVAGTVSEWERREGDEVVLAIGNTDVRMRIQLELSGRGARFGTIAHPRAYVAASATIEAGCVLAPFAFVGPAAKLGAHTALNVYASVGHDAQTGMACVLSPYATLNGNARLDDAVFLGTHATVGVGVKVGSRSQVAAGSVVYRDVASNSLAAGNPARAREIYGKTSE